MNLHELKADLARRLGGVERRRFIAQLFHPAYRNWFIACAQSVREGMSIEEARNLTGEIVAEAGEAIPGFQKRILDAHWTCLQRPKEHKLAVEPPQAELVERSRKIGFPPGLIRELFLEFYQTGEIGRPGWRLSGGLKLGAIGPASRELCVPVLLVRKDPGGDPEKDKGLAANLTFELTLSRTGDFYPCTALVFVERTPEWLQAEQRAEARLRQSALWLNEAFSIRWRLARQSGAPLPFQLEGPSAGGAFLAGLTELLWDSAQPPNPQWKLSALPPFTAVSAALDAEGTTWLPVGNILQKFYAAALGSYPPIRAIVVAKKPDLDFLKLSHHSNCQGVWHDPEAGRRAPLIVQADDLAEAATLLKNARDLDDQGFPVPLPPETPDFIPRPRFVERIERFIRDVPSGYLVIRGQMGRGKTTAMARWIRRLVASRRAPVCHFLGRHLSADAKPERIAAAMYHQLLAKYSLRAPSNWVLDENHQPRPVEKKLEFLLKRLSADTSLLPLGEKEVLYLEAADQADLPKGESLVPRFMCELPDRILCVITTRPDLGFLDLLRGVAFEDFDRLVDDWNDIRDHLNRRGGHLNPPLSLELINRICTPSRDADEKPPWFFTVDARLKQLEGTGSSEYPDEILRSDAAPWRVPPEELVKEERRRIFKLAATGPDPVDEDECWRILGWLAVAGEDLNRSQLRGLGVWPHPAKKLLDLAGNFFEPRPFEPTEADPYAFRKAGYQREILSHFNSAASLRHLYSSLARACANCWNDRQNGVQDYALRHLPRLLREAEDWPALAELLCHLDFPLAKSRAGMAKALTDDYLETAQSFPEGAVRSVPKPSREQLAALLHEETLSPVERAAAGVLLGKLGDPRPGVGAKGGIPDIDWIYIPGGPFPMGNDTPGAGYDAQMPQFECHLIPPAGYRISRYPVTVEQFDCFVKAGGYRQPNYWTRKGWGWKTESGIEGPEDLWHLSNTANHPRVGVSWFEAVAYCRWLNEVLGCEVRLPTEAEWERAARHTDARLFPWGNEKDVALRCNVRSTGIGRTSAVGLFPNGNAVCGAADMAGNVWEWCLTKRTDNYVNYRPDNNTESGSDRVNRGGSWWDYALDCPCAFRPGLSPFVRTDDHGFRLALSSVR